MLGAKSKDSQVKQARKASLQMTEGDKLSEDWGDMIKEIRNVVTQLATDLKAVSNKSSVIEQAVKDLNDKTVGIDNAVKKLVEDHCEIKKKQKEFQDELGMAKCERQKLQDQMALLEMKQRELYLRFRAVPEHTPEGNLREKMVTALSDLVGIQQLEMDKMIDTVYRTNSAYAKKRKEPGDCLILFTSRTIKDRILQSHFQKQLVIDDQKVLILKEIPVSLLVKRKPYKYLTEVLRRNRIHFRWEFPEGISFMFKGKKYRFTEILKVDEFWRKYKKELGGEQSGLEKGEEADESTIR